MTAGRPKRFPQFDSDDKGTLLHQRLRFLRLCYPMTIRQLARKAGTDVVTIINAEKGQFVRMTTLAKIAEALDCRVVVRVVQKGNPKSLDYRALNVQGDVIPRRRRRDPEEMKKIDEALRAKFPSLIHNSERQRTGEGLRRQFTMIGRSGSAQSDEVPVDLLES